MNNGYKPIEWGATMMAQAGQPDCGDQYLVDALPHGLFLAVVDGLGHGPKAAVASQAAVEAMRNNTHDDLPSLVQRCHQALTGTRGAVITLASIDINSEKLTWLSVGNVAGILLRADTKTTPNRAHLLLRGGVVGYRLPTLRPFTEPVFPGDTLILASDGIRSTFIEDISLHLPPQQMADDILERYSRKTDDATVVVARYKG